MQLQEKIAQTYGRARRKVSIGVYDLNGIKPPIYYKLVDPDVITFRPLNELKTMNLREILEKTEKGILYGHIIKYMEKYPVLHDSEGEILSLVPIINSDDYKVTPETRNVLIDATGTSLEDIINAVTIMATSIAERSKSGFIEVVKVHYETGLVVEAPRRSSLQIRVNLEDVNSLLGTSLSTDDLLKLLEVFYYEVAELERDYVTVKPPIYRIDVKTWVDVAEDVAMAYGYEKLGTEASSLPPRSAPGRMHPMEYLSKRLRDILTGLGFQEVANYMMSSRSVQLELLSAPYEIFLVENPRSERFEGLRIWLTPQLLEIVKENSDKHPRIMIFEIGDVAIPDLYSETKARIQRRLAFAISHEKATLTDGLAYIKAILKEIDLTPLFEKKQVPGFLAERTATIKVHNEELGYVGEVDPRILFEMEVRNPVVIAELDLDKIISLYR